MNRSQVLGMPFSRPTTIVYFFILPACLYAALATQFSFDFFTPDHLWRAYNALALSILEGRLDVTYEAIGRESLYYDGKVYFYYGYFPVVLRLLLAPFVDLNSLPLAKLSVWLMTTSGASALQYALLAYTRPRDSGVAWTFEDRVKLVLLSLVIWFGSAYFIIAQTGVIYHETYAASIMFCSVFLAFVYRDIGRNAEPSKFELAAYAIPAALCLHARPTVAVALYAAVLVLIAWSAIEAARASGTRAGISGFAIEFARKGYPALGVLFIGGALLLFLNWVRFDDMFAMTRGEYGYMRYGESVSPRSCAQLFTQEGTFELERAIPNLFYYLFGHEYLHRRLLQLFGMGYVRVEYRNLQFIWLFSSALFIAVLVMVACIRTAIRRRDRASFFLLAFLTALAISPVLILSYRTITIRYTSDLWVLLGFCILLFSREWVFGAFRKWNWLWYVLPVSILANVGYSTYVYKEYQKWTLRTEGAESPSEEVLERLRNPPPRLSAEERLNACREAGYGAWPLPAGRNR